MPLSERRQTMWTIGNVGDPIRVNWVTGGRLVGRVAERITVEVAWALKLDHRMLYSLDWSMMEIREHTGYTETVASIQ
jgi:hypothetical protein